ncbi:MAG: hypothetical protein R3Y07_01900 [Eubacteriales bacterium]
MNQDQRTIAYLCPHCGHSLIVTRDEFAWTATIAEVPCPCGKSTLKVEVKPEGVTLEIPCHVCEETHKASCPTTAFLHEKLLIFSCSGVENCFVGEEGAVFAAVPRMEEAADHLPQEGEEAGAFLNEVVMHEVLSEIKDIATRGGIHCTCGSEEWDFNVLYTKVELSCMHCEQTMTIPAAVADDIDNICCCYELLIGGGE